MNATIFWRIVWKEYRAQRAFWITMVVLTLLMELLLLTNIWIPPADRIQMMFSAAFAYGAFYALGSGAILFATEHESGTFDFLRALPVKSFGVLSGKIAFALASTATQFLVAWALAFALARELPAPYFHHRLWAIAGLEGSELLAWGTFFSLLLKRPLLAVALAVTAASVTLFVLGGDSNKDFGVDLYLKAVPLRLMILGLLVAADFGLAMRWLQERMVRSTRPRNVHPRAEASEVIDRSTGWTVMLRRLVWQELRQSAALSVALLAMLLPTVLLVWKEWLFETAPINAGPSGFVEFSFFLAIAGALSAPLLGSTVFLADQTGFRFRFLTEHAIPPRLVWLSRQVRGSMVMLLGLLLMLPPAIGRHSGEYLLGFVFLAYACGQLCSMIFRGGILAATFGTVLTGLVCSWAGLMFWLGVSWLWSVAPLLISFMVATWLHASNWLLERKGWRAGLRPALAVAVPMLLILFCLPLVRIYEIPLVEPRFDMAELAKPVPPEEQDTFDLYEKAISLQMRALKITNWELDRQKGAWQSKNTPAEQAEKRRLEEQAVTLALEAGRRPVPAANYMDRDAVMRPFENGESYNWGRADIELAKLVLDGAKPLESEGKLDAAFDRCTAATRIVDFGLLRKPWAITSNSHDREMKVRLNDEVMAWAGCSGQEPERLLKGLRTIEKLWRDSPSNCRTIQFKYLENLPILEGKPEAWDRDLIGQQPRLDAFAFTRWLPWERARAVRLFKLATATRFARFEGIEEALKAGGSVDQLPALETSPIGGRDITYDVVMCRCQYVDVGGWMMIETYHRAARLILALEAWKLEKGRLPESLEDLKGKYLDNIPIDPYTGSPFRYEPKGLSHPVTWLPPYSNDAKMIEAGRPFIACESWHTKDQMAGWGGVPEPKEPPGSKREAGLRAYVNLWEKVFVFPIP